MKKRYIIFITLLITFLLIFWSLSKIYGELWTEPQLITISDSDEGLTYSIELPGDMRPMREQDMNEDASLQYANIFKEKYLMIVSEKKSYFNFVADSLILDPESAVFHSEKTYFEIYTQFIIENFAYVLQIGEEEINVSPYSIPNLNATMLDLNGIVDGNIDIAYRSILIETEDGYYQILSWTLNTLKYLNNLDVVNAAQTFQEIKPDSILE